MRRARSLSVLVVLAVALVACGGGGTDGGGDDEVSLTGLVIVDGLASDHVEGVVDYEHTPPMGGPHNSVWQNCGFYDEPINSENAVHSLEHGAVWITFQPDLPEDQIDEIKDVVDSQTYLLGSPFEGLGSPVVASAWGRQISLDSATDARLEVFIDAFRQGPDAPEPNASCSGGTGSPS